MTPFAQLGQMTKQAVPAAPGYKYQKNSAGLNDPYLPQVASAPKGMSPNFELAGDLVAGAAGMIPGVGGIVNGVWQGGKAIYHTATGQYGKAAEDVAWGAAGFIPGAAMAGAVGKGARLASKVPTVARAISAASPALKAAQPALGAAQATRVGGLATKAAPFAKELVGDTITGTTFNTAAGLPNFKNNPAYQLPTAPPPAPAQMPAWQSQMFNSAQYGAPASGGPSGPVMGGLGRPWHPYMM
jgi:hypothetical protein